MGERLCDLSNIVLGYRSIFDVDLSILYSAKEPVAKPSKIEEVKNV